MRNRFLGDMPGSFIKILPKIVGHPLAIVAVVIVASVWLFYFRRLSKSKDLLESLKRIPSRERSRFCEAAGYKYNEIEHIPRQDRLKFLTQRHILIAVVVTVIAATMLGVVWLSSNPATSHENSSNPIVLLSQPDYIAGTSVERKDIEHLFPFGYAVLYPTDNKRYRYEVFNTGLAEWGINWTNTKIVPDVAKGTVEWEIAPEFLTVPPRGRVEFAHMLFHQVSPLKTGIGAPLLLNAGANQPRLYFLTLNDDQRSPVFAIGFRIQTANEPKY